MLTTTCWLTSCQNNDELTERVEKLETTVSNLSSALTALQTAHSQGLHIKSVEAVTGTDNEQWRITLSDDRVLHITNSLITAVGQDEKTGAVWMQLSNGQKFEFSTRHIIPTSIAMLTTEPITLEYGTQDSFEFRVNPSNAVFKYAGEDAEIQLDKAGESKLKSYVTTPDNYRLVEIKPVFDDNNQQKVGQYRAIIEDTKHSARYHDMAALVLNVVDANGDAVQISSNAISIIGNTFGELSPTGLPMLVLNTPNATPIVSKEEWISDVTFSLINPDISIDYYVKTAKAKGRGNATFTYPKKPYKFKLNDKYSPLGRPESKKWQLLAEYCDKSFLRTACMLEMSKAANFPHTVKYDFVELYLNGNYNGLYILTEQVEKDKNRINIKNDGFIFEHDNYATQEPVWFSTERNKYNFSFKYPDPDDAIATGDENYNFIKSYMDKFETALYSENYQDPETGYRPYIDAETFAKWYIVMELLGNLDPNWYYVLESKTSKLQMYPCWDAEWSLGLADDNGAGGWKTASDGSPRPYDKIAFNGRYFERLLTDPYFKKVIKDQWETMKTNIPQALQNLKDVKDYIRPAANHNFEKWQILGTRVSVGLFAYNTWEEEANFIFTYFDQRYKWFDSYVNSL